MDMITFGRYVLYRGRVCIVDYVDEYGTFLKDFDNDDMIMVSSDNYDDIKEY